MKSMKAEIREYLSANLEAGLDTWLQQSGFGRRKNALVYTRNLAEAVQKIEIALEIHPKDRPDSAAVVYPFLEVRIESVNALVMEMTGGNEALVGAPDITLREPIAFTSGNKGLGARWPVFQPDSVPGVVGEVKSFLQQWTLPFLDLYSSPAGICEVYDRSDKQLMRTDPVRVAAAMVLCGRTADAIGVMERYFGRPGPRKQYQKVFDYLAAKNGSI